MSGTLGYNANNLMNLSETLNGELNTFKNEVEALMSYVDSLATSGYWTGAVYDQFKTNIQKYKQEHIDTLVADLEGWVSSLSQASQDATANTTKGLNIVG